MILDTTVLIDVLRGTPAVGRAIDEMPASASQLVTAISVMELWEGIHRVECADEERDAVLELLDGLTVAEFSREAGEIAGRCNVELESRGAMIDLEDVMIAATAIERDQPVLTRNEAHYEQIDDLEVISY